jgi:hypothetical protein
MLYELHGSRRAQYEDIHRQAVDGIDVSQGLPPLPSQVIDSGPL